MFSLEGSARVIFMVYRYRICATAEFLAVVWIFGSIDKVAISVAEILNKLEVSTHENMDMLNRLSKTIVNRLRMYSFILAIHVIGIIHLVVGILGVLFFFTTMTMPRFTQNKWPPIIILCLLMLALFVGEWAARWVGEDELAYYIRMEHHICPTHGVVHNQQEYLARWLDQGEVRNQREYHPDDLNKNEEKKCVVCWDRPKNRVLLPCNHAEFCHVCAQKFLVDYQGVQPTCPLCREPIMSLVPLHGNYRVSHDYCIF